MKKWWKWVVIALMVATVACSSDEGPKWGNGDPMNTCGAIVIPLILAAWRWL